MALSQIPSDLISSTATFDSKTPITKVIPELKKYAAVVVSRNGEYYGIIDTRAVYRAWQSTSLGKGQSIERFAARVPRITTDTSVDDLVYYFYRAHVKALPYYNGRRIVGILERGTLLKMLLSLGELKDIKVREAMTTPVLSIAPDASIAQAKAAMRANKVNRLAVLDGTKLAGLVTNYDIVQDFTKVQERLPQRKTNVYSSANVLVSDVMEKNPAMIDYERSLSEAVRQLVEKRISSVMVLRKGSLAGMLTVLDVLERIVAKKGLEERNVYISGLDADSYQYSDEIREELKTFMARTEKLSRIKIDYITLRVKRVGNKSYEIQTRLSLGRNGIINLSTTRPSFQEAFRDIIGRLRSNVRKEKEMALTARKVNLYRESIE